MVAFQQHEFDTRQAIAERPLRFAWFSRWRLLAAPTLGVQPFGIDPMDCDQPLHHNLRALKGKLDIFLFAPRASMTADSDAVSWEIVHQQRRDFIDRLLSRIVK